MPDTEYTFDADDFDFRITIPSPVRNEDDFILHMVRGGGLARDEWKYDFRREGAESPLFAGNDFETPTGWSIEYAAAQLMGWLTIRDGDTDIGRYEAYNEDQKEWADSFECDAMTCVVADAEQCERDDSKEYPWTIENIG